MKIMTTDLDYLCESVRNWVNAIPPERRDEAIYALAYWLGDYARRVRPKDSAEVAPCTDTKNSLAKMGCSNPDRTPDCTIENDIEKRRLRNEQRDKEMNLVERWVLGLKIDWNKFHERHCRSTPFPCDHTTTVARRILAKMGLDKKAIEICLQYFAEVGGGCDCEISLNVDMTNPRPLPNFKCRDCDNDYDEYSYMVHDHVWKAGGLPIDGGMLCIGCLEERIGRRLCRDDFKNASLNGLTDQSLRLQDRMNERGPEVPLGNDATHHDAG